MIVMKTAFMMPLDTFIYIYITQRFIEKFIDYQLENMASDAVYTCNINHHFLIYLNKFITCLLYLDVILAHVFTDVITQSIILH